MTKTTIGGSKNKKDGTKLLNYPCQIEPPLKPSTVLSHSQVQMHPKSTCFIIQIIKLCWSLYPIHVNHMLQILPLTIADFSAFIKNLCFNFSETCVTNKTLIVIISSTPLLFYNLNPQQSLCHFVMPITKKDTSKFLWVQT